MGVRPGPLHRDYRLQPSARGVRREGAAARQSGEEDHRCPSVKAAEAVLHWPAGRTLGGAAGPLALRDLERNHLRRVGITLDVSKVRLGLSDGHHLDHAGLVWTSLTSHLLRRGSRDRLARLEVLGLTTAGPHPSLASPLAL